MITLSLLFIVGFAFMLAFLNYLIKGVYTKKAFIFGLLFFFLLIPGLLFLNTNEDAENTSFFSTVIKTFDIPEIIFSFLIIIVILFFIFFLFSNSKHFIKKQLSFNKFLKLSRFFLYFTLIVGGVSFLIFILQFDSIAQMLSYGEYSRSFIYDISNIISARYAIMIVPARFLTVTPLLCIFLYSNTNNRRYFLLFIFSLVLVLLFMLYNSGKVLILTYALYFLIPVFEKRFKHPWGILLICGFVSLPLLGILDSLFVFLTSGRFSFTSESIFKYFYSFSYPFENFMNRNSILGISGLRFGKDYLTSFLSLLPGLEFEPSYVPTSIFYGGSDWHSGTPNDFFMFSYLQFSYLGIIAASFFLCIICKSIDDILRCLPDNYGSQVIKSSMIVQFFMLAGNSDLCSIIKSNFVLLILLIMIVSSTKRVEVA